MTGNSHRLLAREENQATRGGGFAAVSVIWRRPSLTANDLDRAVGMKRDRLGHTAQKCAIKSVSAV